MLKVLTLEQSEEWDSTVSTFEKYDIYYLSGYVRAFKLHGDGEPLLIYCENGETKAINVVMKRDIAESERLNGRLAEGKYFDITTPYGYGGWLIEGNQKDRLFKDFECWCRDNGIVAEFVRYHPMLENQAGVEDYYAVSPLGETVAIDLTCPNQIFSNMSSKNRNVIRKATKNDVEIYQARNPEIFETFRAIYNETMDRDKAEPYYYFRREFYESICHDLPEHAQVFYAVYEGRVIAASIMLTCNGYMNYHLSGSVREYRPLAATNLLLYRAALWGSANGCRTLYLGGGVGSGEDSLFKFKRAFYKGDLHRFYIGKKIYDKEQYDQICKVAGVDSHSDDLTISGFFPEYRAQDMRGQTYSAEETMEHSKVTMVTPDQIGRGGGILKG